MSLEYIQSTFLTFEQLAALSGLSADRLRAMMAAGCLPGPAYRIDGTCRVRSIFGEHEETIALEYYPRSHVGKARALELSGLELGDLAVREKAAFFATYAETIQALRADTFGLQVLYGANNQVGGRDADAFLEKEWQAYLAGTYGLCTRTASAEDIATKEAMIAKIQFLTEKLEQEGSDLVKADLEQAVDLLDQVSALFAPHELARSSREKYVNQVRDRFL